MKKIALILVLMISFTAFSQVSLKGYTLGEKLRGDDRKQSTVAKIDGWVQTQTLKDGRIWSIIFMNGDFIDDEYFLRDEICENQLNNLLEGVEKKYNVELENLDKEGGEFHYMAIKDGIAYHVLGDEKGEGYTVSLSINSLELSKVNNEEIQSDF